MTSFLNNDKYYIKSQSRITNFHELRARGEKVLESQQSFRDLLADRKADDFAGYFEAQFESMEKFVSQLPHSTYDSGSKLIEKKMTWKEARDYCKNKKGNLVRLTSQRKHDVVKNLITKHGTSKHYWIEGSRKPEAVWAFSDGSTTNYNPFAKGEPNISKEKHAVALIWQTGKWDAADESGDRRCSFVCEWDDFGDYELFEIE